MLKFPHLILIAAIVCSCTNKKNDTARQNVDSTQQDGTIPKADSITALNAEYSRFAWLAGSWHGKNASGDYSQTWTMNGRPEAYGMLLYNGKIDFTEKLAILKMWDRYGLMVMIDDKDPVWFPLYTESTDSIAFRNEDHQPELIVYKKINPHQIISYTYAKGVVEHNGEVKYQEIKDEFVLTRK